MNEAGNEAGSVTVGLPEDATKATLRELDTLRAKHGARSAIGIICSNLMEQVKELSRATDPAQIAALIRFTGDQRAHLARLLAAGAHA